MADVIVNTSELQVNLLPDLLQLIEERILTGKKMPDEEQLRSSITADAIMTGSIARGVYNKFGELGVKAMREQLYQTYRKFMPSLVRQAGFGWGMRMKRTGSRCRSTSTKS